MAIISVISMPYIWKFKEKWESNVSFEQKNKKTKKTKNQVEN